MQKKISFKKEILKKDIVTWGPAIILYFIYHTVAINLFHASCPMILLFGIPCPGCGMTRAVFMVLTLQFEKALYLNPVAFLWVIFGIYLVITRYFTRFNPRIFNVLLIIVLISTFARYAYGMINYYPNRIPYVKTSRNITNYILSLPHY